MNNTALIGIVFAAIFLYHGIVYTAAWLQCGNEGVCAGGKKQVK